MVAAYGDVLYDAGMAGKKVTTTVYITEDQNRLLKELNRRTRVPIAEYIREGIDLVLSRNNQNLPGQLELAPLDKNNTVYKQPEI